MLINGFLIYTFLLQKQNSFINKKAVEGEDEGDSIEVDEFVKSESHQRLYQHEEYTQSTQSIVQEYHHVESSSSVDRFLVS